MYISCLIILIILRNGLLRVAGIIVGMGSVYEERRYIVTAPLIGWTHTHDDPCALVPTKLSN